MPKKQIWSSISRKEDKPWGHTFVWSANGNVQGKIITILAGKRTSLKYNPTKNEVFYVVSGSVKVIFGDSLTLTHPNRIPYVTKILKTGDVLNVQSECPYRIESLEDSILVEVADRHDSQTVILEDDYGRKRI